MSLAHKLRLWIRKLHGTYPNFTIDVTGHSLGGAIAILCALDVRRELLSSSTSTTPPNIRVWTFGKFGKPQARLLPLTVKK
jgi:alpha-beta hydrolase superfamily lysophospholipase